MHILKEGERVSVDLHGVICEFLNDDRVSVELDDGRVIVLHIGDIRAEPDAALLAAKGGETTDCGYACRYIAPHGFVPECGCPVHDPEPYAKDGAG